MSATRKGKLLFMENLPNISLEQAVLIGLGLLLLWIALRFVLRLAQTVFNLGCLALLILFAVLVARALLPGAG
jgi:hypothetical protein